MEKIWLLITFDARKYEEPSDLLGVLAFAKLLEQQLEQSTTKARMLSQNVLLTPLEGSLPLLLWLADALRHRALSMRVIELPGEPTQVG